MFRNKDYQEFENLRIFTFILLVTQKTQKSAFKANEQKGACSHFAMPKQIHYKYIHTNHRIFKEHK